MAVTEHITYLDEPTFERLSLSFDENDAYVVEGSGSHHRTMCVMSPEFEASSFAEPRVLPSVGNLWLTKQGGVVVCPLNFIDTDGAVALALAAAELAASKTALERRSAAISAKWLN